MGDLVGEQMRADPGRALAGLEGLRELTGTEAGAQRVAWTPTWARARVWLREQLVALPVEVQIDEAGNLWAELAGADPRALVIGSHLDSVPDGGWLDGSLGVLGALEVLRALSAGPRPPLTVRLVDWADEEGARFGRSLLGSSAAAGLLDPAEVRDLHDAAGVALPDALREHGVELEAMPRAARRLRDVVSYVELHIEQGPVLEAASLPLGVVDVVVGARRHRVRFEGRSSHAGSTPMPARRDPVVAAARLALAVRAGAVTEAGVATVGAIHAEPGIPTAVAGSVELFVDQRHRDAHALARMLEAAQAESQTIAAEEGTPVHWSRLQEVAPVGFDKRLVGAAERSVRAVTGDCLVLPSGALHDAAMVARAGVPAVMLFVQSIDGISHNRVEDSHAEHLADGVLALDRLVREVLSEGGGGRGLSRGAPTAGVD